MYDIVFCNVPYVHLDYVYPAPAILRGVVQKHGFSARTKDFGSELFKICNRDLEHFYKVQNWFISNPEPGTEPPEIEQLLDRAIDWLREHPAKFIGISVLSWQSQIACLLLIQRIKKASIPSKIVIGGRGIQTPNCCMKFLPGTSGRLNEFNTMDIVFRRLKLVDHAVRGDGEDPILEILGYDVSHNNTDKDTFRYPTPDYSDYELDCYHFENNVVMWPIIGSKGCVRSCDFCDVGKLFGKYRYRSPQDVAAEMIYLNQTVGARHFQFADSLVNGGPKPFREMLEILADYNDKNPDKAITWQGQYICRPAEQIPDPDTYYKLLYRAGGRFFYIGVESGSNRVLAAMNKKTTVESFYHEIEQFRRHGITCLPMLVIGHWSETHEDFLQHLDMLINLAPYVRSGTIVSMRIGVPMLIFEGTPSHTNLGINGITTLDKQIYFCANNPDNTITEKIYRQLVVLRLAQALKLVDGSYVIHDIRSSLGNLSRIDEINDFYEKQFEKISSS